MVTTAAKAIHSAILKIFFAIIPLVIGFSLWLSSGILLQDVNLPGLRMRQFYIKLDKKLILSIDNLHLTSRTAQKSDPLSQLHAVGEKLKWLPLLFERIHINNMSVGDFRLHAEYDGRAFDIVTDRLHLTARLRYDSAKRLFAADDVRLRLKKPAVTFYGRLRYLAQKSQWRAEGSYEGLGLAGNFSLKRQKSLMTFALNSQRVASLRPLVQELAIPRPIAVWMADKIRAKGYLLKNLSGQVRLTPKGPRPLVGTLKGEAYAYNAAVRFHPAAPPVLCKHIRVTFENDTLFFGLKKPVFRKIPLEGSRVTIGPIIQRRRPPTLTLTIRAKGPLDKRVTDLLALYHIPLPFRQTKGVLDAETKLTFRLTDAKVTDYEGRYTAPSATLLFDDTLPVPVEDLHVTAKGKNFTIRSARIAYPPYLLADLTGTLALEKKSGDFSVHLKELRYPDTGPLVSTQNETRHVTLRFDRGIHFLIPSLQAEIGYQKGAFHIDLTDLSRLAPYFDGPLKGIRGGQLALKAHRKETEGALRLYYPNKIFTQKGKPLERFEIRLRTGPKGWRAQIEKIAHIEGNATRLSLNYQNIDIRIPPLRQILLDERNASGKNGPKVRIFGRNTTLFLDRATLACDSLDLLILPRPFSLSFLTRHGSGTIKGAVYGQKLQVTGKNLPAYVIRSVSALHDLYGGYFNFDAAGTLDDFSGTIGFRDTLWAKSATYNNILATLNTVPALLSLKNPGFNRKGFKIKKGQILYRYKAPEFIFKQIAVHGESADIFGNGRMNFDKEEIHAALQIRFLETVTDLMQKIPVAGYLLFGKEGNIAIGLHIDGPVKNPEVETDTVKNIVTAPFNIIRRTITLPFHLDEAF